MIHPTPAELLASVADALSETVLPELEAEAARIQLQVAVLILRRLAGPAGDIVPFLVSENRDIAETVDRWLARLSLPDAQAAQELVDDTLATDPVPPAAEFVERYERLQALLVDIEHAVRELPPESADRAQIDLELRALLIRMLARDSQIHTTYSAW